MNCVNCFHCRIEFIFVACQDFGGPRKEFFTLFLKKSRELLVGDDDVLREDSDLVSYYLEKQLYYVYGLVTGM